MKRLLLLLSCVLAVSATALAANMEKVLIRADKPYDKLVTTINTLGGKVTYKYTYVNAIAAEVPASALAQIRVLVGPNAMSKDLEVPAPTSRPSPRDGSTASIADLDFDSVASVAPDKVAAFAAANPNAYLFNNATTHVADLQALGFDGTGVLIAQIDSGLRPGFPHINVGYSTVIGGEDFVGDGNGFSNFANNGHGTFVAGMMGAHVIFTFAPSSDLLASVKLEAPSAVLGTNGIPMIGSAPNVRIYGLRVFPPTGGAPTSRILAAIDRVIQLRDLFDAGDPSGLNLKVCNMSLGGSTVFAGRDLEDQLIDVMLAHDIVPVISSGNAGPSSLTVGSPGTSRSAVTVGAASMSANERILRDLQFGLGIGPFYRPFSGIQMSYFSSRGPDADGRIDPDVVTSGFANYGQGFGTTVGSIDIGSGTSFSAPTVAGIAAVLRQKYPSATARQIRNAIIASANPALLADGSINIDRGNGFVDAKAASDLLATGTVSDSLPAPPKPVSDVKVNVEKNTSLNVVDGNVTFTASNLLPGQRADILYRVLPNTSHVVVNLSNLSTLPPAQQNQLFGDDILLAIHSAKTSAIGEGDYKVFTFTTGGTFVIDNPETGLMRITVNGDWTNAGAVGVTVNVVGLKDPLPQFTAQNKILQGQDIVVPVNIPAGVSVADFRTIFRADWSNYPTSDIDMILVDPASNLNLDGAALNDPEHAVVNNPKAGLWFVIIDGFEIDNPFDKFELRVALDGKVVH
ncbi:MAG: S8 family serine peptidase [Terriglobales bacterium]